MKKKEKEIESYKHIKIPDWIYWGSGRVVLRYKNPDGKYIESEFYPMDYEEVETEQAKQLNRDLVEKQKEIEKRHERYMEEIRRLREDYPYRGKAVVFVEKDGVEFRVQITKAYDTREGLLIKGRI